MSVTARWCVVWAAFMAGLGAQIVGNATDLMWVTVAGAVAVGLSFSTALGVPSNPGTWIRPRRRVMVPLYALCSCGHEAYWHDDYMCWHTGSGCGCRVSRDGVLRAHYVKDGASLDYPKETL